MKRPLNFDPPSVAGICKTIKNMNNAIHRNLKNLNKDNNFLLFRERSTNLYFIVAVVIAIIMVLGFYSLDIILNLPNLYELLIIRVITSIIMSFILISKFLMRNNRITTKVHLYLGFYLIAFYSPFLSHYAGGIQSSYWAGLNFILIFWLSIIPFSYKELIYNSIIFIFIYDVLLLLLNNEIITWAKFIEYHFFFFGTLTVGSAVAYLSNLYSAKIFINQNELEVERNKLHDRNKTMEHEIALARKIQDKLIPEKVPIPFISAVYEPMEEVGGDFYDFIEFNDSNNIGIFLSDVSGHGVPAAFITSMIKTIILQAGDRVYDPAKFLFYMNEVLQSQTAGNFVTAFYCIYNPDENSIYYANAGHNQPYVISQNNVTQLQKGKNTAIAMFPNHMLAKANKKFENHKDIIEPGSKLLLYTDGLVEARPRGKDTFFEYANMEQVFKDYHQFPCDVFLGKLMEELTAFRGSDQFEDDICLICLDI